MPRLLILRVLGMTVALDAVILVSTANLERILVLPPRILAAYIVATYWCALRSRTAARS